MMYNRKDDNTTQYCPVFAARSVELHKICLDFTVSVPMCLQLYFSAV